MLDFTIAICTYNGAKTLSFVVDSILALQDYDLLVNEVILIDNASTDNTKEICESYQKKSTKIKYIYEACPGLSNARRRAVAANGAWVIYVDDDNILKEDWLVVLKKTIESNSKLGVINGAVIARPVDALGTFEEARLQTMYRNLACTHIRSIDYSATPNYEPIGAGMCIIASALKEIDKSGWLKLSGRKGQNLASGEDTELCRKVFARGYKYFCNYDMQLDHLIPKVRLTQKYTDRLLTGLMQSRYILISDTKHYVTARFLRSIKYCLLYLKSIVTEPTHDEIQREQSRQDRVVSQVFLKCVLKDRLIHKES